MPAGIKLGIKTGVKLFLRECSVKRPTRFAPVKIRHLSYCVLLQESVFLHLN